VHRKNSRKESADEKKEGPGQKEDTPLEFIPYRPEGEVYQKICLCQVLKELPETYDDREEHKDPTV